jgi:hypothetical protein
MWGALSDERTGLSITVVCSPRQRSHSCVRAPWNTWPYFTASHSRFPQPGGPGPRIYIPRNRVAQLYPYCLQILLNSICMNPSETTASNGSSVVACYLLLHSRDTVTVGTRLQSHFIEADVSFGSKILVSRLWGNMSHFSLLNAARPE